MMLVASSSSQRHTEPRSAKLLCGGELNVVQIRDITRVERPAVRPSTVQHCTKYRFKVRFVQYREVQCIKLQYAWHNAQNCVRRMAFAECLGWVLGIAICPFMECTQIL